MAGILTPSLAASSHQVIEKHRELPIKGEILVKVGERVIADTVVGKAKLPGFLYVLRVADALEITPSQALAQLKRSKIKVGDEIVIGQLIAAATGIFGFFKREFLSPVSGTIEYISDSLGHIGVRGRPEEIELRAFIGGVVKSVEDGKGIHLRSEGAFVQGAFGVGGERRGVLRAIKGRSDEVVKPTNLPELCEGAIIFGGAGITLAAVKAAAEKGAVGIVTGSITDEVLRGFVGHDIGVAVTGDEPVPLTLIVTEGFGQIPMAQNTLSILEQCNGLSAGITGVTQVRAGAIRPEIIVEKSGNAPDLKTPVLEVGSRVRLIRVPFFGRFGVISDLPHDLQLLATGAMARAARVVLEDTKEEVMVPRANLELQL